MKVKLEFHENRKVNITAPFVRNIIKGVLTEVKNIPTVVSISVALISDVEIRRINKKYRNQNKVTDVLSFSGQISQFMDTETDLGEIVIAVGRLHSQAKTFNHSLKEEFTRLLVHGVLHLLGYDHEGAVKAKLMERLEKKIIDKLKSGKV